MLEDLVSHHVVCVGEATSRVRFESVHVRRHLRWVVDGIALVRDAVGEAGAEEAVVTEVQNDAVVVYCVFDHLEGEANAFGLPRFHVVRGLDVVEQFLLRFVSHDIIDWYEGKRSDLELLLGEGLVVLIEALLDLVAFVANDHANNGAGSLGDAPGGLADALVWHPVKGAHPVLSDFVGVPIGGSSWIAMLL